MSSPTLLLIHGLGATPGVWSDLRDVLDWPGRVVAAELPGHGTARASHDYSVGAMAAAVGGQCDDGEPVIALGHSLGGAVALCLASGFYRPSVTTAIGLSIKLAWAEGDAAGMAKVAAKGVRWFETRDQAVERFLLQAGLNGIADADHPAVVDAVSQVDGRWRVTQDPQTFAQRPVDAAGLVSAARCPIILGAGEHDAMVSHADMAAHVNDPRVAVGRGHNVHVEDPQWVRDLLATVLG